MFRVRTYQAYCAYLSSKQGQLVIIYTNKQKHIFQHFKIKQNQLFLKSWFNDIYYYMKIINICFKNTFYVLVGTIGSIFCTDFKIEMINSLMDLNCKLEVKITSILRNYNFFLS